MKKLIGNTWVLFACFILFYTMFRVVIQFVALSHSDFLIQYQMFFTGAFIFLAFAVWLYLYFYRRDYALSVMMSIASLSFYLAYMTDLLPKNVLIIVAHVSTMAIAGVIFSVSEYITQNDFEEENDVLGKSAKTPYALFFLLYVVVNFACFYCIEYVMSLCVK